MQLALLVWVLLAVGGAAEAQPTYTREIARIFRAKCEQCHRAGDIAPFALGSYEEAVQNARAIRRAVEAGKMPPWKPVAGHGEFRDNFSLTEQERETILAWVDGGTPEGEQSELPEALPERGEWSLGLPDLSLEMPEEYAPPKGRDMYRCFVLPTSFDETRYVSAADILPGDRRTVHHVILYLDTSGKAEELDAKEEGPGYTCFGGPGTPITAAAFLSGGVALGGWAPGTRPRHLPEDTGMTLPARARIVMQVHYHVHGEEPSADRTRVGLYFNKAKPQKRLFYVPVLPLNGRGEPEMEIPANAERHEVKAAFPVPPFFDARLVQVFPHMHLLGREIRADLDLPLEQGTRPLIYINDWDFHWQGAYTYVEAVAAPAFSTIRLSCVYDNSTKNPNNPHTPPKTLRWGEGTEDEMCLVFLGLTFDRDRVP